MITREENNLSFLRKMHFCTLAEILVLPSIDVHINRSLGGTWAYLHMVLTISGIFGFSRKFKATSEILRRFNANFLEN
jgi:hypothetical protein